MSKKKANILLMLRKSDPFSKKLANYIKKKFKGTMIIWSSKPREKNKIPSNLRVDFIFAFRSYYILNKKDLLKTKFAAINFHPGPPNFRGFGCANFALFKNSKYYGVTSHIINKKIDSGKIIDVKYFKITKKDNLDKLLKKTHGNLYKQAKRVIPLIIKEPTNLKKLVKKNRKVNWSKKLYKKRELENLYIIKKKLNKKKKDRIIRATYLKNSKFKPKFVD